MSDGPAAVVLGSAFSTGSGLAGLSAERVPTRFGTATVHRHEDTGGVVIFRHGLPHRWLPHQVPWRAHALALAALRVRALLLTSSVGAPDPTVPLYQPHLAGDLVMLDNRLPDGSMCTVWPEPHPDQGHLVLRDGLFHSQLSGWMARRFGLPDRRLVFGYVAGPRTKSAAENRLAAQMGIEVNSMSVGPEVVLAAELEIPTAALLVVHKSSGADGPDQATVTASLERSQAVTQEIALAFLAEAPAPDPGNVLYRFDG